MIRLIGLDVDGTLLDSGGRLPAANLDAIHAAVAAGVHVALVTGRSYPYARPVATGLPDSVTLMVSSGAVERAMDGTPLARRLLDRATALALLSATQPYREQAALIFDRDAERQMVHESMDWTHAGRRGYWDRNRAHIHHAATLEGALDEDPIEVMFSGEAGMMRELAGVLQVLAGTAGRRAFSVSLTEYVHRDFSLVDVTASDATKGRALAWRAQELGLTRDQVMAVGDNLNDLDMLEYAGTPVLMGNAVPGLRDRGWVMTGHQDEAGVAQAIARFVLSR